MNIVEIEYHIHFPKKRINFTEDTLTLSINHIKSRVTSVLFFKLKLYGSDGLDDDATPIYTYTSPRWVVDESYRRRTRTFDLPTDINESTYYYKLEFVAIGISSENPLYFAEVMLNEGEDATYHPPNEAIDPKTGGVAVGLFNSRYANLYDDTGNFLQVIRPDGTDFSTNLLTACACTVLSPHFAEESDIDNPINVFMEFINQKEQIIDVLR